MTFLSVAEMPTVQAEVQQALEAGRFEQVLGAWDTYGTRQAGMIEIAWKYVISAENGGHLPPAEAQAIRDVRDRALFYGALVRPLYPREVREIGRALQKAFNATLK